MVINALTFLIRQYEEAFCKMLVDRTYFGILKKNYCFFVLSKCEERERERWDTIKNEY